MRTSLMFVAALALLTLAASVPARAFTASEDFSSYTPPTTLSSTDLTAVAGAGTAGTGASGNGWLNGWRSASTTTTPTARVTNTTPINAGGNYLTATLTSNAATGTLDAISIARAYDVAGASLSTASSISIGFDFRVDSITSTFKYDLFDNSVRSTGATSASYNFRTQDGVWNYFNGATLVATTLSFSAGTTYSFNITLNPVTSTYSFTISDGTNSVSASGINFRNTGFATDTNTGSVGGRWLTFNASETTDIASQATTFSVDNISITAIPEPSTYAALLGAATLGFVALRRRRLNR